MSPFDRGRAIEHQLDGMGSNFPTIDKYTVGSGGVATDVTSIKSIDLTAASYQNGNAVYNNLMRHSRTLSNFQSTTYGSVTVNVNSNTRRILEVAIPPTITPTQQAQITRAIADASNIGVDIITQIIR
jgi:Flp pilus assembly protein TadG